MLIDPVTAEHVGRAHATQTAMVSILRRAGRIIRWQIVERRRHPGRVEIVPEGNPLPLQDRGRLSVIERPEIKGQLMVTDFPPTFAREHFRRGVDRLAFGVRMAVYEVEDSVRAWPGPIDE